MNTASKVIRIFRTPGPNGNNIWISVVFAWRGTGWLISQIIGDDGREYVLSGGEEVLAWIELANSLPPAEVTP